MIKNIKRLVVYDWDGTLCKSPENTDENKKLWESITGKEWDKNKDGTYKRGWWGKSTTLDSNIFDIELVDFVKEDVINSIKDEKTFAVLMTGRLSHFYDNIIEIMNKNDIPTFDRILLNGGYNTQEFKVKNMYSLFEEFPNINEYVLWEDRLEHIYNSSNDIPSFLEVGNEWSKETGGKFTLNIMGKDFKLLNK